MRFSIADPTAQPGLKEELAQAIKEMDTRTSSFSEAEVFDKLRGVLGNKQVPPEDFTVYLGESNAFFFSPKRKDDAPLRRLR